MMTVQAECADRSGMPPDTGAAFMRLSAFSRLNPARLNTLDSHGSGGTPPDRLTARLRWRR